MYSLNTLQVNILVKNVLSVIKQEKDLDIEVKIQSELSFLTNEYRNDFYSSYNRHDEEQKISHNHIKVPTVYCVSKFSTTLAIHLLNTFSSNP